MSSKKPPPDDPKNPEATPVAQPVEFLVELLATAAGQLQGLKGTDLQKHVADLSAQVQTLAHNVEHKVHEEEARKVAAAEAEQLIDTVVRTGTAAGQALEASRAPILNALRSMDLQKLADAMRLIASFISSPTADNEAQAKQLVEKLQATLGPMVGFDPAREDEQRRAQIKADVRKSLDEIFRPKKPTS
jgi:outer membrane murein-binding lipoprotein Lpp